MPSRVVNFFQFSGSSGTRWRGPTLSNLQSATRETSAKTSPAIITTYFTRVGRDVNRESIVACAWNPALMASSLALDETSV